MSIFKERHWTRHSLVLTVAGLIYIGIGYAFIVSPGYVGKDPSLKSALRLLTLDQWGYVYMSTGLFAMVAAFSPIGKKTWGYMILTSISSAWAMLYVISVVSGGAPRITLLSSLIWLLLAFIWWAVSGLLSPEHVKQLLPHSDAPHEDV